MLKKLLKYDLKWTYKLLVIFYALALIFSCITRLCSLVDNSALFSVLKSISAVFAIAMMVNAIINCIMRSWVRFTKNMYKDESYLTHTLPVSKNKLYLSKVLSAVICMVTSIVVVIACLFICYYSKENISILKMLKTIGKSIIIEQKNGWWCCMSCYGIWIMEVEIHYMRW